MKRFYKFLLPLVAIVAMALPWNVSAQVTVSIGDGGTSTNSYLPNYEFYNYSLTQQIYTAEEIGMAGDITSISFYTGGSATRTLAIYMVNTTQSSFSGSSAWIVPTAADQVFSGSVSYTASGWTTITLTTPFSYDGASNLAVIVDDNTGSYVSSIAKRVFTPTSGGNCAIRIYSDGTNYDALAPTSYSGTTMTMKNQIQLEIMPANMSCYPVRNLTASNIGPWSCTLTWVDTNNAGATYTVMDMADSTVLASGVTDTTVDLTNLTSDHAYTFGVYADCGGGESSLFARTNVHTLVSCPPPTALTVDSVTTSDISLHWTPGYQEAEWYLSIGDSVIGSVTDTSYTISDLNANTVYTIYLRAVCGADDSSVVVSTHTRTLPGEPVSIFPYTCDFEDTVENAGWVLENGSQPNAWYIGTAVNNGGTQSLYVSNNNGTSNAYGNGTLSHVYAYRYINFSDTGSYVFSFDWHCQGESNYYDYLRAWLSPASVIHEAGDGTTYNYSTLAVPGCIDLVGANSSGQYTLAGSSNFTTHAGEFRISTPGTYKLVFLWSNDGSGGSNPPAAVDNVFINTNSCPAPYNLVATYVGSDTIELSWAAGGEETSWLVSVNGGAPVSVSSNTLTLDGLNSNTAYNINVQAECGGDDVSIPASLSVRTACGTINLPFSEDFTGMASSSYPDCWTRVMSGSYPYITTSYGNSIQFGGTAAVIAPYIAAPLNQMIVSFDLRKEGSSSGSMTFGYTSDPVAASDMVVLHTIDPSTTATYFNYEYDLSLDSAVANLDPDSVYYLVWRQNGSTSWYYWLDNVNIEQYNPCTKPQNFTCTSTQSDSVVVTWNAGDASSWELYVGPAGVPVNEDSAFAVTDSVYVFTNLQGGVAYNFYVRTDCGGDYSNWAGPLAVTPGQYIIGTSGSASITMCGGVVYDDGGATGQYSNNADYTLTIAPSHPDSMLTFQGWAYTEGSIDYLRIYEGTSPTGTILWQTSTSSQLDNIPYTIVTSGPITLKWHTDGSVVYDGFELQIGCMAAPECSPVDNLTVHPTPTAALLTWQPGYYGVYSGATVEYKADSADASSWIALPAVTGTYAVISGLDPETDYNVRITTDCDGFPGGVAMANFSTKNYGCLVSDSTGSRTITVGTGSSTTSYFPSYSCYNYSLSEQIFTPTELGGGGNLTAFTVTPTSVTSANRTVEIYMGHVSDATLSNFVYPSDLTLVYTGTTNFVANQPYTFTLDNAFNYNGSANLLVLVRDLTGSYNCSNYFTSTSSTSGISRYVYQDSGPYALGYTGGYSSDARANTTFNFLSCLQYGTCAAPAVAVTDVTTTTATLVWAPGSGETSWNIYYRVAGTNAWSAPLAATGSTFTVTGLNAGTNYEFKVENVCSEGDFASTVQAATLCAAVSLPYTENFNGWGVGQLPNCWYNTGAYSPTSYSIISPSQNMSGTTGGSVYMYSSSGSSISRIIMPEVDTTVNQMNQTQLVFNVLYTSTSYQPNFIVGVMSDPQNISTFVPVDTVYTHDAYNQWEVVEVPLDRYTGNGAHVAIETYYMNSYFYCYIDDITLEQIPTCLRPDSLSVSNATTTTVDLAWHERGNATEWIVEYGPVGFQPGTGTQVTANSNPFTLTGVPSSYQGEYYVKAVCGAGDTGEYSRRPCTFNTTQVPATLPYSYDFEDPAEWANWQTCSNQNNNWFRGSAVADSSTYSMYMSADSGATYIPYQYNSVVNATAYRDVDFGPVDSSFTMTIRARAGGSTDAAYDGLIVLLADPSIPTVPSSENLMTPWGDVRTLYQIMSVRIDTTWQTYSCSFDTIHGVQRVAFYWLNQNTQSSHPTLYEPVAVDNITINYSSCPRPLDLEAVATTSSALLSWRGEANATYEITYREVGGANQTVIANTNSYNLTGLTSPNRYVYWVRRLCGPGDTSLYSDGKEFSTPCATITTFPWVEDFENDATFDCWAQEGDSEWELGAGDGTNSSAHSGTQNAMITHYSSGDVTILISPILALDPTSPSMLSFWHTQPVWAGDQDELRVYYRTSQTDTWHQLLEFTDNISTWTKDSVLLPNLSATYQIAFEMTDGYGYGVGLDDITVTGAGSAGCAMPVIDSVMAGETSIVMTWVGEAASYEVAYVEGSWNEPTSGTPVTGLTHTITGLTAGTQYFVGVRAVCGESLYSDWAVTSVTTAEHPCYAPSNVSATGITINGATISWTAGEAAQTNFQIRYSTAADTTVVDVTTNPYTLTGLLPNTSYSVAVRAVCGQGNYSDWSDAYSFTTTTCQPVSGVAVSDLSQTTATVTWTAGSNSNGNYEVAYGIIGTSVPNATHQIVEGSTSYTITGLEEGTGYVVYVRSICAEGVQSDWTSGTTFTTEDEIGIADVDNARISLYPNPASSTVTLMGIEGAATVTVVDMNGREVYSGNTADGRLTIDVSGMSQGAYFVRITGEQVNAIRKLIVR